MYYWWRNAVLGDEINRHCCFFLIQSLCCDVYEPKNVDEFSSAFWNLIKSEVSRFSVVQTSGTIRFIFLVLLLHSSGKYAWNVFVCSYMPWIGSQQIVTSPFLLLSVIHVWCNKQWSSYVIAELCLLYLVLFELGQTACCLQWFHTVCLQNKEWCRITAQFFSWRFPNRVITL